MRQRQQRALDRRGRVRERSLQSCKARSHGYSIWGQLEHQRIPKTAVPIRSRCFTTLGSHPRSQRRSCRSNEAEYRGKRGGSCMPSSFTWQRQTAGSREPEHLCSLAIISQPRRTYLGTKEHLPRSREVFGDCLQSCHKCLEEYYRFLYECAKLWYRYRACRRKRS